MLVFEIEHGEDGSKSECDEDEDKDNRDQKDVERCTRHMQNLMFKDVEESLNTLSGKNKENVCYWLQEFEDMAGFCKWSVAQKVIHAKRLLRGPAKIFVNYERFCRNWSEIKQALRSEFSQVVDAHKIHKEELSRRIKKSNETYQENSRTRSRRTEEKTKETIHREYGLSRPGVSSRELLRAGDELLRKTLYICSLFCPAGTCVQLWRGIRG